MHTVSNSTPELSSLSVGETKALSESEQSRLEKNEQKIRDALLSFVEMGEALEDIRDKRLYRKHYKTFDEYCRKRWNFGDKRAYQHIKASRIAEILYTNVDIVPTNEGQVRPLVGLPDEKAIKVWKIAEKLAGKKDISAGIVRKAVATLREVDSELPMKESHPPKVTPPSKEAGHPGSPIGDERSGSETSPDNDVESSKLEAVPPLEIAPEEEHHLGTSFELADGNTSAEYHFTGEDDLLQADHVAGKLRATVENNTRAPQHLQVEPSQMAVRQDVLLRLVSEVNKVSGASPTSSMKNAIYWAIYDLQHLTAFLRPYIEKTEKDDSIETNSEWRGEALSQRPFDLILAHMHPSQIPPAHTPFLQTLTTKQHPYKK